MSQPEYGSFCAPLRPEEATEAIYATFDPGIVGVCRALHAIGFTTRDSGDGKHKATIGWDEEEYSDCPHVQIVPANVDGDGRRLAEWARTHGLEVEVQAFLIIGATEADSEWVVIMFGDSLYGWTPTVTE